MEGFRRTPRGGAGRRATSRGRRRSGARARAPRSEDRGDRVPVVHVAEGILDERLVLVVSPFPVDDEFVLVVPRRQIAHDRENLHAVRRGLGRHRNRLQPVREGAAQVDLGEGKRGEGRDGSVRRGGGDQPRANGPTAGASRECYPGRVRENALVDGGGGGKRAHLLAAVRPDEPRGEDHLLVHRLLRHGARLSRTRSVRRAKPPRVVRDRRPRQRKSTPRGAGDDSTPSLLAGRPPRARQVIGELLLARSSVLRAGTTRDGLVRLTPRRADRATSSSSALSLRGFARARVGPQDSRTDRRAGRRAGRGVARGGVPRAGRIRAGRRARSSMFFHLNLDKHVLLEPRHFGKNMREVLEEKLRNEVRARNREERRPSSLLGRPPPPGGSARVRQRDARGTRRGDRST